ncbi:MAG: tRNA (adenosine(37)-N6)-threonylcarbamoyltransferase complex ATPase subunit type 1 TsaE [Acetivibrionales bacterium]|jgi:tRNA threonylcarbamoyladenosine biosynthesis protein TsaE
MKTEKDDGMPKEIRKIKTQSEKETIELGRSFSQELKAGETISLEGDLGTGKTAFTKGIASGLGIIKPITSPTFTLVNTYNGKVVLNHFDVYRIDDSEELLEIGWEEYFTDDSICIVEWGDRVLDILPQNTIRIRFERDDKEPDSRIISIERQGMKC